MNSIVQNYLPMLREYQAIREQLMAALTAWYVELDHTLEAMITALTENNIANKSIDRGNGWQQPLPICLDIYKEALIIFYGKASIYLRALGKLRPQQMQEWIG